MNYSTATFEVDTTGLTLLHPRTSEAASRSPPTVNIVFVHGLRGHPRKTWEYSAPVQQKVAGADNSVQGTAPAKNPGLFSKLKRKILRPDTPSDVVVGSETIYWPADSLPSILPRAKIWTYGYNAGVNDKLFQPNNQNSILEHGNDFMMKMERALRDKLPIIFVAHSLGGLVVKAAINGMQSNIDPRYQRFSHRIRAIVFCGTPHRGSDAAAWGKLASNLLAIALVDSNSRLLSDMRVDSRTLSSIQADFLKALHREPLRIHSFQEGRALTGVRGLSDKVVGDYSSRVGWAPETFETIDADHREMVRKPGVKDISDILKDLEREAVKAAQSVKEQVEDPVKKEKRLKLLSELYTSPYEDRKDRNPELVDGTCQWFINHQLFKTWEESKTSNLLWVSADPGCVKSVLAKYLADDVLSDPSERIICYFFFKDDFDDQKSPENALCCILHQIFVQSPALLSDKILDTFARDEKTLFSSFRRLWNILVSIASDYNEGEILCILDALDECITDGRSQMAEAICKFYQTENNTCALKFLLTSRPYLHIQREFQLLENHLPTIHLRGENQAEVDKIEKEIDLVIKYRVEKLGEKLQLLPEEQQILQHELTRIPNRTYLWVYLMFDVIEDMISITKAELREVIRSIPKSIEAAYDKILCRSRNREKAMRLLHIVVAATRPLSLQEMALALAIDEKHRSYADLMLEPGPRFCQTVRDLCGLFVTIIDSNIYLLHQTAKEFLVQQESVDTRSLPSPQAGSLTWKFSLQLMESHRIVAEICIQHLLFNELKSSSTIDGKDLRRYHFDKYVFFDYSANNWITHFQQARVRSDSPMQRSVLPLFSVERAKAWFGFYQRYMDEYNDLILVSYFGLEGVARLLLKGAAKVKTTSNAETPLHIAARRGHEAVVQLLLDNGADIEAMNKYKTTALYNAVSSNHEAIVRLLLRNGADTDIKDGAENTPLLLAAGRGYEAIVQLLLESGADINAQDVDGRTALYLAVKEDRKAITRLLLKDGADTNLKGVARNTPLHVAASYGDAGLVQLLLESGADTNLKGVARNTPLHIAATYGDIGIVQLLLESGADTNAQNVDGRTALHWAVIKMHEAVVRLLLKYPYCVNERDHDGNTALHLAVDIYEASTRMAMMPLFLESGADVDSVVDKSGWTVLDKLEGMVDSADCISLCRTYRTRSKECEDLSDVYCS